MSIDTTPVYCLRHRQLVQGCPLCWVEERLNQLEARVRDLEAMQSQIELAVDTGFEAECPNCHYVQVIKE
jgi:hypothetical protein